MEEARAVVQTITDQTSAFTTSVKTRFKRIEKRLNFDKLPPHTYEIAIASFAAGSLTTVAYIRFHAKYWKRFPTGGDVPESYIRQNKWIKGYVASVGDGDNFRMYHTPGVGWRWPIKFRWVPTKSKDLVNQTLHIRMAGVDAPEAPHFGRPGQPYADEALAWLKSRIEGRTIYCQLVLRDQYQRIVAVPHLPPFYIFPPFTFLSPLLLSHLPSRCVSLMMLKAGWAYVYEQAHGCYGVWGVEAFRNAEEAARKARRGIWKDGKIRETPAQYKAKNTPTSEGVVDDESSKGGRGGKGDSAVGGSRQVESANKKKGWFRQLFTRS